LASVSRNLQLIVARLEATCLGIESSPDQRIQDHTNWFAMVLFEHQNRDHSVARVTQAKVRGAISDPARFVDIRLVGQNNYGDTAIGTGKRVSIDINKIDSIFFADGRLSEDRHGGSANGQDRE